jgi:hypothetical protein
MARVGRKGRTKEQILADRAKIAERYLKGTFQVDIAREIGVSQQQVSYDLKVIRKEWLNSMVRDFDRAKAEELAKIDNLEAEYWQAWKNSLGENISKTVKTYGKGEGGDNQETTTKTIHSKELNGDPRYLEGVRWCIERRCKLLGLDAPDKHELTGKDGRPIQTEASLHVYIPDNGRDDGNGVEENGNGM